MNLAAWLESVSADMRFGLRQFFKAPMITTAVILSLAIGIGANTAVFALLDAAMLKPLPVPDPDRLVLLKWSNAEGFPEWIDAIRGSADNTPDGGMISGSVSTGIHRTLSSQASGFESIVGTSGSNQVSVAVASSPAEPVDLEYVSPNFFEGLYVTPALGRSFLPEEDQTGVAPAAVVSYRFWMSRLGGNPSALGQTLRINDVQARVVGIAPRGFFGTSIGQWSDLYVPLAARSGIDRSLQTAGAEDPGHWWVQQIAVLSPDVPESAALARLGGVLRNQVAELAGSPDAAAGIELISTPGGRGIESASDEVGTALWLLMLLVGLLLLIVCANVANLLLARSEGRLREASVRLTLGATPARLFRQQFIESLMLALIGGAAGVLLGYLSSRVIHDLFQVGRDSSEMLALQLDARIIGFGLVVTTAAALLFGISPAVRAARAWLADSLSVNSRSIVAGRLRGPKVLVSAQLALCLTALVAAGLLGRSLKALTEIELGFDPENLVYATVDPGLSEYPDESVNSYFTDVERSLEALPGVLSVSRITRRPLEGGGNFSPVNIPGGPRGQGFDPRFLSYVNDVSPDAFETLGIPLRSGDTVDRVRNGVVVDERFADRFFPGQDAIGRRFGTGAPDNDDRWEIVGIAGNVSALALRSETPPTIYMPHAESVSSERSHFVIRTVQDPTLLIGSIRNVVASVSTSVPLTEVRTQAELLERMLRTERLLAFLSAAFGLIATGLAAVGLAGLLAYAVARRTSEIGLRMALGADPGRVIRMVMRDSLGLVAAGLIVGIPCAFVVARLLESSLYQLGPGDPATMLAAITSLVAISMAAAFLPAHRAAKTAPSAALKED